MADYDGIPDDDIWNIDYHDLVFQDEIARGSFGKVYKGSYLGVPVAIKQIFRHDEPAYMKYIEREISVLKGIRHPFIVGFCGVCLHDSGLYIVTEYVEGGDVRALLKNGKPSWERRIQMASDLAKAMYYLHSKKIIHRDLKSKNLLIGSDGKIRLCDFGFARVAEFAQERQAMTICGTPGFVAPEIMLGLDYDERCDTFSFGNVLAELITFQRPGRDFWNRTADDNYKLNLAEFVKLIPKDCPKGFSDLAIKCVNYDPAERPSFADIMKELKKLESEVGSKDSTKSPLIGHNNPSNRGLLSTHRNTVTARDAPEQMSYLQTITSQKIQLSEGETKISARHIAKMIQRATTPDYIDSEYIQDLLLTYPCFVEPTEILELLITRYKDGIAEEQNTSERASERMKKSQLIQIRVIVFINTWIEKYPEDFRENGMMEILEKFDKIIASTNQKDPISFIKNLEKVKAKKQNQTNIPLSSQPKKPMDLVEISKCSISELAKTISFLHSTAYKLVNPREYLKETWKRQEESNLKTFLQREKDLTRWIVTALVRTENKDERKNLLERFIDLANSCLSLKDFAGVFSIMNGLQHPSVERLTKTWSAIRPSFIDAFKTLQQLTSKEDAYKNYKSKQEVTQPPNIPYLDVFLDELSYIDSFNPDIGKGGIINFSKHRKLARLIRYLEQPKNVPFQQIEIKHSIRDLLLYSQLDDDDLLQKRSYNCEPPSSFS